MNERLKLPNFDPGFCLTAIKWAAASCVGWLAAALAILALVDPSGSQCPGWVIHAEKGNATSLWVLVGLFTALPTIWICFLVTIWEQISQKIYDSELRGSNPSCFPGYQRDYNGMFAVISIGWSLFCTAPLWIMLTKCVLASSVR